MYFIQKTLVTNYYQSAVTPEKYVFLFLKADFSGQSSVPFMCGWQRQNQNNDESMLNIPLGAY